MSAADEDALFRAESLEAAYSRFGGALGAIGIPGRFLTALLVAVFATGLVFICTAKYARKETVVGVLQPAAGALRVTAPRAGFVSEVLVREGDLVAKGQPLLRITSDPTISDGRRLGDVITATTADQADALKQQTDAKMQLLLRQREEIVAKRQALLGRRDRLVVDHQLQQRRVELAEETSRAAKVLKEQELMSGVQYRQREDALLSARQALAAIETEQASIAPSLAQLAAQEQSLVAEGVQARAAFRSSDAQLRANQATNAAEASIVLVAQEAGQVAALQAKPGATIIPGAALAIVLPKGVALEAELWVPSRATGFVRSGDDVRLMYEPFPYQRFGVGRGRVISVARAPISPGDLPEPIKTDQALYRVQVRLDRQDVHGYGRSWPLAAGTRLTADMILERQTLMAWLFDKVRAVKARGDAI